MNALEPRWLKANVFARPDVPARMAVPSRPPWTFDAYSLGMDREAYGYLEDDAKAQLALYAEASTDYAKAQLYAQMVTTQINKLKSGVTP